MKGNLLLVLIVLSVQSIAQKAATPTSNEKKHLVNGYTIKVLRNPDATYGYVIYKGTDRYVKQFRNPYTGSIAGLRKKEDVFRTAEWIVKNIIDLPGALSPSKKEYTMLKLRERLPVAIATRLKVDIN